MHRRGGGFGGCRGPGTSAAAARGAVVRSRRRAGHGGRRAAPPAAFCGAPSARAARGGRSGPVGLRLKMSGAERMRTRAVSDGRIKSEMEPQPERPAARLNPAYSCLPHSCLDGLLRRLRIPFQGIRNDPRLPASRHCPPKQPRRLEGVCRRPSACSAGFAAYAMRRRRLQAALAAPARRKAGRLPRCAVLAMRRIRQPAQSGLAKRPTPGFIGRRGRCACMGEPAGPVRVTVLVDGIPRNESLDGGSTVGQIIGDLLPADQKARADDYQLSPKDGPVLDPASVLGDGGISDGSVLALTKKDGGGGSCSGQQRS